MNLPDPEVTNRAVRRLADLIPTWSDLHETWLWSKARTNLMDLVRACHGVRRVNKAWSAPYQLPDQFTEINRDWWNERQMAETDLVWCQRLIVFFAGQITRQVILAVAWESRSGLVKARP